METMPIGGVLKNAVESLMSPKSSPLFAREKHPDADRLWNKSRVMPRHRIALLRKDAPADWQTTCTDLIGKIGTGFFVALVGKRGTGKTQIGAEIIRESCLMGRESMYTDAIDIFVAVRETFSGERSEKAAMTEYSRPQMLVIDEVQERGETAWEDRLLTSILNKRYGNLLDTLLISNLTAPEFAKSLGASAISRLVETGGIIECTWESFRK